MQFIQFSTGAKPKRVGMVLCIRFVLRLFNYCYLLNERQTPTNLLRLISVCVRVCNVHGACGLNANDVSRISQTLQIIWIQVHMIVTFGNVKCVTIEMQHRILSIFSSFLFSVNYKRLHCTEWEAQRFENSQDEADSYSLIPKYMIEIEFVRGKLSGFNEFESGKLYPISGRLSLTYIVHCTHKVSYYIAYDCTFVSL